MLGAGLEWSISFNFLGQLCDANGLEASVATESGPPCSAVNISAHPSWRGVSTVQGGRQQAHHKGDAIKTHMQRMQPGHWRGGHQTPTRPDQSLGPASRPTQFSVFLALLSRPFCSLSPTPPGLRNSATSSCVWFSSSSLMMGCRASR